MENGIRRKYFIIHPGAYWKFRQWPVENYASVCRYIINKLNHPVIITGSPQEQATFENLVSSTNRPEMTNSYIGPLRIFMALLSNASGFIGSDGGAACIASGLTVPSVTLYGPNTPKRFGNWHKNSRNLYRKLECSPCGQITCSRDHDPCMHQISVDQVLESLSVHSFSVTKKTAINSQSAKTMNVHESLTEKLLVK